MTSATYSDHDHWHQLTQAVTTGRAHYELQDGDAEAEEAYSEYNEAWGRMIAAPAPTVEAIAFKVRSLIEMTCLETTEDTVDNPAFLQRLLDRTVFGIGAPLVWILKDAFRLAGVDDVVLSLIPARQSSWPMLADRYRSACAAHEALFDCEGTPPLAVSNASYAARGEIYQAVLAHPATTAEEVAQKAELMLLDADGRQDNVEEIRVLLADALRLAGGQ